jgi:hypothetical protein
MLCSLFDAFSSREAVSTSLENAAGIGKWAASRELNRCNKKPPGFAGRFVLQTCCYSPPPKRRDHHPARRGWVSVVVSEAGC